MGVNVEHKISDNFLVGATFLKMSEDRLLRNQVLVKSQLTILFFFQH
jgi:hypothetical protein